jgi:hypothetical protein
MMRKKIFYFGSIMLFLLSSCHTRQAEHSYTNYSNKTDQEFFFPVTEFFLGELRVIDSLPVTPLKITIVNGKSDSTWISKSDVKSLVEPFLTPLIDSTTMYNLFSENSFLDQAVNAVTLTYDPKAKLPDSLTLNHWDVYIDPQENKVRRIYLVKQEEKNENTVTTQLTWEAGKWCSIRTIVEQPKIAPDIKETVVKWNFDE